MSVNFGASNTSRYYTFPADSSLDFPNSDWTVFGQFFNEDSGQFHYLFSTGAFSASVAVNMYVTPTLKLAGKVNNGGDPTSGSGAVTTGVWYNGYVTRRSSNIFVGLVGEDGVIDEEGTGVTVSAASAVASGGAVGQRSDVPSGRYMKGEMSSIMLMDRSIVLADAQAIRDGASLIGYFGSDIKHLWPMHSSTPATIKSLTSDISITKVGSSYETDGGEVFSIYDDHEVYIPITLAGGSPTLGVQITGYTKGEVLRASETGFYICWADSPGSTITWLAGTHSMNASGVIEANVDALTALTLGQAGVIGIYKPDGTDEKNALSYFGTGVLVDIS